jgi:hypothetical protein
MCWCARDGGPPATPKPDAQVCSLRKLAQSSIVSDEDFAAIKAEGYSDARLCERPLSRLAENLERMFARQVVRACFTTACGVAPAAIPSPIGHATSSTSYRRTISKLRCWQRRARSTSANCRFENTADRRHCFVVEFCTSIVSHHRACARRRRGPLREADMCCSNQRRSALRQ